MDVTVAIIHTVSSLKWKIFQKETGNNNLYINWISNLNVNIIIVLKRFCYECLNKATGDRKCIVCGGNRMPPVGKLMYCELCPRVFHHDCSIPPMLKVPRGIASTNKYQVLVFIYLY